jgi:hypothetical protein
MDRLAQEAPHSLPLPAVAFEARRVELVSVSRRALVQLGAAQYSVPSSWAGLDGGTLKGV